MDEAPYIHMAVHIGDARTKLFEEQYGRPSSERNLPVPRADVPRPVHRKRANRRGVGPRRGNV